MTPARAPAPRRSGASRFGATVLAAHLVAGGAVRVSAATGPVDTTLVPVPFVATGPTSGEEYGVIFALLRRGEGRNLSITAPSVSYGDVFGLTGTFRHYWYPEEGATISTRASYGTKGEQYYIVDSHDSDVLNRTYSLDWSVAYQRLITYRYFGVGADSVEDDETNYTREELGGWVRLGVYLTDAFRFLAEQRIQKVNILEGALDLPAPEDLFPGTPGLEGGLLAATRVGFLYDDRDSEDIPNAGWYGHVFGEIAEDTVLGDFSFRRIGAEWRLYLSGPSRRFVTVIRGVAELVDGEGVPFYELSTLGGDSQLRGFGENRWADEGKVLASIEERIRFVDMTLFDVFTQLELAFFGDVGKVFSRDDAFFRNLQPVGGVGLRFIVPPNVVATVDVGVGVEGAAAFAVLGYPF